MSPWQRLPAKTCFSETCTVAAPAKATCTARQAGCCLTDTCWIRSKTAAHHVTPTKVALWINLTSQSFNPSTLVRNARTIVHLFLVLLVYNKVFWKGCLPGSQGNLCKVCLGGTGEAATKRCADNHNERYYGNMGALRLEEFFYFLVFCCGKRRKRTKSLMLSYLQVPGWRCQR